MKTDRVGSHVLSPLAGAIEQLLCARGAVLLMGGLVLMKLALLVVFPESVGSLYYTDLPSHMLEGVP